MKATETKFLDFLRKSHQFVIPIYQRTYSWTGKECRQLWNDIIRCGSSDKIVVHFVGSIVYIEKADSTVSTWEPLLVIDGQQRMTTVTLLIAALAQSIGDTEPLDGFSADLLRGYYLMNTLEKGERKFKLVLSQTDKDSLIATVSRGQRPADESNRIVDNYKLFEELIAESAQDLPTVCKGLAKLMMVDIKLKRGEDNPQLIFESMNSTGKELSQADLIRNYILMGLEHELQTEMYDQFWRPMEVAFGQEAYGTHFDSFMRHYLTVKTGEIPNINAVYDAFKEHSQTCRDKAMDEDTHIKTLVQDIRNYAGYFCAMALDKENDADLKLAFQDLRELKVDVAYPLLLELYHDYKANQLSKSDLLLSVRLIESYVFRRAVCAIPTNSMNKTFATIYKGLKKDHYLESLQAQFLVLPSYRRLPSDEEFHRDLQTRDLYNFRNRSYWLRRLENHERKLGERVLVNELTIEHIMPQNQNLSNKWREDLGNDWKRIQQSWLHTLGNLTLTAYNSDFSDRTFNEKRDMPGAPIKGLKQSPLKLNEGLGSLEKWDESAIKTRANKLADLALKVWTAPMLTADVLEPYRPKAAAAVRGYTINDHPYLLTPTTGALFEAFRKAILALDPNVNEDFLRHYVAYKAETNFVDVFPMAKKLKLTLNIQFSELNDPQLLCKDISGWRYNGDVQCSFSTMEELPYILGLVRQSLELQLGNNSDE